MTLTPEKHSMSDIDVIAKPWKLKNLKKLHNRSSRPIPNNPARPSISLLLISEKR